MSAGSAPLISVNMVTYNQAPFLRESIRCILNQTFTDWELVIVDDGSTDGTPKVIAEFTDPRIVAIRQANQGPGGATNTGLRNCRGQYVAFFTGDDLCSPERLELQLAEHRRSGGIVFSNVDYVDEESAPLVDGHYPQDYFLIPPMTQAEVLRKFYLSSNFINTITLFAELDAIRQAGPFEPLFYGLQDFDLLLRLIKKHPFTFLKDPLVSWRIRREGANLSATQSKSKHIRNMNETYLILKTFFDDLSPELFREALGFKFLNPESRTPDELACERAFLNLRHPLIPLLQADGLQQLLELLREPRTATILAEKFFYRPADYVRNLAEIDPTGIGRRP
jgi:glycosyltransferase involved in cell wall biosynthesis